MRREVNTLIKALVDARFALDDLADECISQLRRGYKPQYRSHVWTRDHYQALEHLRQGVEAAFSYAKWLQFPECEYRLAVGAEALTAAKVELLCVEADTRTARDHVSETHTLIIKSSSS